MKELTGELRFKIFKYVSSHYLIKTFPDNWFELTEAEQNQFIIENVWQPLEYSLINFLKEEKLIN